MKLSLVKHKPQVWGVALAATLSCAAVPAYASHWVMHYECDSTGLDYGYQTKPDQWGYGELAWPYGNLNSPIDHEVICDYVLLTPTSRCQDHVSSSGNVQAVFTWVSDAPTDTRPTQLSVLEVAKALASANQIQQHAEFTLKTKAKMEANNGFSQELRTSAPGDPDWNLVVPYAEANVETKKLQSFLVPTDGIVRLPARDLLAKGRTGGRQSR